jgi:nucleotide-binding universal stress UspA family protein
LARILGRLDLAHRRLDEAVEVGADPHVVIRAGDLADPVHVRANRLDSVLDALAIGGADLLVIGNKGMQRRVLGSVPNSVTHGAPCSVLVVKTT